MSSRGTSNLLGESLLRSLTSRKMGCGASSGVAQGADAADAPPITTAVAPPAMGVKEKRRFARPPAHLCGALSPPASPPPLLSPFQE